MDNGFSRSGSQGNYEQFNSKVRAIAIWPLMPLNHMETFNPVLDRAPSWIEPPILIARFWGATFSVTPSLVRPGYPSLGLPTRMECCRVAGPLPRMPSAGPVPDQGALAHLLLVIPIKRV